MRAYGFGFGAGALHRRRLSTGTPTPTPTPTPSLPVEADLAIWARPEDLALSDGATVASWTDGIADIAAAQATSANRPTFRAAVAASGGKPGVEFNQTHSLTVGRPAALIDALGRYNDTTGVTMFFVLNVGNNPSGLGNFRAFWSPSNINDSYRTWIASSAFLGQRLGPRYKPSGGFKVIVVRRSSLTSNQASQSNFFENMGGVAYGDLSPHASNDYVLGGDGTGTATYGYVGHIHDWGCYNRALTNAEICRLVKYFHDKYEQPYPWAGLGHFDIFDGDSQTYGTGASAVGNRAGVQQAWPNMLMDARGRSYDAWCSLAIGSRLSSQLADAAAIQYAGLREALGIPVIVHAFEYYNKPDGNAAGMKAYLAAVKAADPGIIIACGTSIDNGQLPGVNYHDNRASFNAALETSTDYDVFVPLHMDPMVGVEGACPDNPGPYGPYFSDIIGHPTNTGYQVITDFWSDHYDDAVALL